MTINIESLDQVDSSFLRTLAMEVRIRLMGYFAGNDQEISDEINRDYKTYVIPYTVTPDVVRMVRTGRSLH